MQPPIPDAHSFDHPPAALVTGASRGIGLALARVLHDLGYRLTLVARDLPTLEAAARSFNARSLRALPVAADVTDETAIAHAVATHQEHWHRLDVLVNNAGLDLHAPVSSLTTPQLDGLLAVNLRAPILLYRETLPLLQATARHAGAALVVNVASLAALTAPLHVSLYAATKAALITWSDAMNAELGPIGVRSVALLLGLVDTDMTIHARSRVPREHMIPPGDVAEALRFCLTVSPSTAIPHIAIARLGAGLQP